MSHWPTYNLSVCLYKAVSLLYKESKRDGSYVLSTNHCPVPFKFEIVCMLLSCIKVSSWRLFFYQQSSDFSVGQ